MMKSTASRGGLWLLVSAAGVMTSLCVAHATPPSETDESTVPHYFGPYPNWANSPLTLADAAVTFTDATGTGAQATATVGANGAIIAVAVTAGGTGYSASPSIGFASASGTGATASVIVVDGSIASVTVVDQGTGYVTPGGIPKFTDELPLLCDPAVGCPTSGKYIPLAVPVVRSYAGVDCDQYEIGLVQYRTGFSSSLPNTLVRGYVQIDAGGVPGSQRFPLTNTLVDGTVVPTGYVGVTAPQFLGPVIAATRNRPVRLIFRNLLPTGMDGALFLPTDTSMMGAGMGPVSMPEPSNFGSVMDEARNPMCTDMADPTTCFANNRATIHLHGGATPWISDGTVHQWITPAGEAPYPDGTGARMNRGDDVVAVPDMWFTASGVPVDECAGQTSCTVGGAINDPGPGAMTFYYPNQQSARMLWYHDHAWGITRLGVYTGEASAYMLSDDTEQSLVDRGLIPGPADTLALIVQDRTFVPRDAQLYGDPANGVYGQDPTWNKARWGGYGNLWYHHVYQPAQNPGDVSGQSDFGRWMYGPWFWPPATSLRYGPIANPYYDMDPSTAFTTALPMSCQLDDPSTWQYPTSPFCEPALIPGTPNISVGMEQFNDTPLVNGVAYPTLTLEPKSYRLRILNAANDRFFNLQWYIGEPGSASSSLNRRGEPIGATEVSLNPTQVAAAQVDPVVIPDAIVSAETAGPDWIQIASEGGFLPAPAVLAGQQPITYITDATRFDVGNGDKHSLLLSPAERADVIVDFSRFAGRTLILYNDAPAAFPARSPGYDYYTGAPDMRPMGAPPVLPGYGPNTRTILQVKIADTAPAPAFDLPSLDAVFVHHLDGAGHPAGVFESGQNPIIVGQAAYNSAYGTSFTSNNWCNAPGSTSQQCDGFARIAEQAGEPFGFNTLASPDTKSQLYITSKASHDEMNSATFDDYGRMTANLGVEVTPATPGTQNIVLYPFVNPQTELIDGTLLPTADTEVLPISNMADGTQLWKITHNGVDTHPFHFHLFDVQVVNRVTWDNIIIPPEPNELGWKDTVRVSPLEDTILALRPVLPTAPFEMPNSIHRLDPGMPAESTATFNNIDTSGNPTNPIVNELVNYGAEYLYHCHILSHEEMDMMRPVSLVLPPRAPSGLVFDSVAHALSWEDNSINETSFIVQKTTDGTVWSNVNRVDSPLAEPNTHGTRTFTDDSYDPCATTGYRVAADNTVGYGREFPIMTAQSVSETLTLAPEGTCGARAPLAAASGGARLELRGVGPSIPRGAAVLSLLLALGLAALGLRRRPGGRVAVHVMLATLLLVGCKDGVSPVDPCAAAAAIQLPAETTIDAYQTFLEVTTPPAQTNCRPTWQVCARYASPVTAASNFTEPDIVYTFTADVGSITYPTPQPTVVRTPAGTGTTIEWCRELRVTAERRAATTAVYALAIQSQFAPPRDGSLDVALRASVRYLPSRSLETF